MRTLSTIKSFERLTLQVFILNEFFTVRHAVGNELRIREIDLAAVSSSQLSQPSFAHISPDLLVPHFFAGFPRMVLEQKRVALHGLLNFHIGLHDVFLH